MKRLHTWSLVGVLCGCGPGLGPPERTGSALGDSGDGNAGATDSGPGAGSTGSTTTQGPPEPTGPCGCDVTPSEFGCGYEALVGQVEGCASSERLCPTVTVRCEEPSADIYGCANNLQYDADALRCAVAALRNGSPGLLEVEGTEDWGIFSGQRIHLLRVEPGGTVLRNSCITTDVGAQWSTVGRSDGVDAAALDECLEAASPAVMYACLWDTLGSGKALPQCE